MRDIARKLALVFAALLLVVGGVALCPGTARAGDSLPNCGNNLSTQFGGDPMVLSIDKINASGTGDMYTWNSGNCSSRPWHSIRSDFMYADLGEGVTSIGSYAFFDCSKLRIIAIPRTVTSIGANAFLNCVTLKYVVWDGTQAEWDAFIASSAVNKTGNGFLTNPGIKLIRSWDTINRNYENIQWTLGIDGTLTVSPLYPSQDSFIPEGSGYTGSPWYEIRDQVTAVDVEFGVTSIGDHAFNFMTNLKSATLPSDLTHIGYMAFRECTSLTSVTIPASVTMIESNAFYKCSSLVSVTFEGAQTAVYEDAFDNCSNGLVITGYAIDDAYHAVETPNSSVPYLCYSRHIPFNAVNGDLGAYTIDLTSGSAVLHDSVMDELRVIRASWGVLRMLEERGTVAVPTENEGAYDLDKNGSPDVVLGFEYDPDDFFGDSMLATFTVAPTNSVEGDKTFKVTGTDRYVASMHNPDGFYYSSLTFRFKSTSVPIYRMYNTKTSEHLYTTRIGEYNACGSGNYADWKQEGVAWRAPSKDHAGAKPVYRLYNLRSGDHHYTTSTGEKNKLLASGDWRDEGIAFYSGGDVPIYRVYNGRLKRGQHHYTKSAVERDSLVANNGWRDEGVGFHAISK